jgi:hypothetical protein
MTKKLEQNLPTSAVPLERLVSDFDEDDCLSCYPFDGDFGCPDERILKDKIVVARKGGKCFLCGMDIKPGTRVRTMSHIFEGELKYYRWCTHCCYAMAKWGEDDGEEYERRAEIGRSFISA